MFINRAFSVVRYEKSLLFDDARTRNSILKKLRPTYPIHDLNEAEQHMFFLDPSKKVKITIKSDHVVIDIDEPLTTNILKTLTSEIATFVMEQLEIERTTFIGVRVHYIAEKVNDAERTNRMILDNFFSADFIKRVIPKDSEATNPTLGFSLSLDAGLQMNVNIGANQKVNGNINNGAFQIVEVLEVNPLIDLDVYTQEPKEKNQINGVIKAELLKIEKYFEDVRNSILRGAFQ